MTEPQPSLEELEQIEVEPSGHIPTVPVKVEGPVQVHELPSLNTSMHGLNVVAAELLLPADRRRKRALLIVPSTRDGTSGGTANTPLVIARSQGELPTGVLIPVTLAQPVELQGCEAVWGRSSDGIGVSVVGVIAEHYAD